ncbi:MAG TPA: histidine phosphatase family protein [Xanthobacteraceae bacterium]|jgi:phosphohistidine phosphatase|nr:histidine phosphatase family protein [Xanthobacteraceae bacterium]
MRRLLLLRHAKTERAEPGERDRDRKLTKRGRNDAPMIGAYMAKHNLVPDLALVSPSARTQETWALVAPCFAKTPPMEMDDRIYNASTNQLVEVITETKKAKALLMIGHNPSFHELAVQLVAAGDVNLREQLKEGLPTSGLVVIDLPIEDWSLLHPRAGRLERFVTPRLLAEATE